MRSAQLLVCLIPFVLAACSSTPPAAPADAAPATQAAATAGATPNAPGTTAPAAAGGAMALHLDPNSTLNRERSVYFDFDKATVRSEYTPLVERHGQYLVKNAGLSVVVQGNTDERGSAEYNLALGQQRAEAVRSALRIYGVKETQVEAVSFGREKPVALGHDEAAWAQNRRADIVYPGK